MDIFLMFGHVLLDIFDVLWITAEEAKPEAN